jgi:hypothetical protein
MNQATKKIMQWGSPNLLYFCLIYYSTMNTGQYASPKRQKITRLVGVVS